jgi:flagellar operon protein
MTSPVNGIGGINPAGTGYVSPVSPAQRPGRGNSFAEELRRTKGLNFSKHAAERVQSRGMSEDPETIERLEKGVDLAAGKGSRSAVVMVDSNAYVVAVPNRTVITALDRAHMKDHVFTNIDSAVIA